MHTAVHMTFFITKVVRLVVLLSQLNYSVHSWLQLVSFSYAVNGATS